MTHRAQTRRLPPFAAQRSAALFRWVAVCCCCLGCCVIVGPSARCDESAVSPDELEQVKRAERARVETVRRVYGAVVSIYGNDRKGGGSGVLFDEAGFALTNHHVVAAAGEEGWAGLADGQLYRWKLIGTDPGGDVAVIRLAGKDRFPAVELGDSRRVQVGDWVLAMGNPFVLAEDHTPTVTLGIVSGTHRYQAASGNNTLLYGDCIQIDTSINPGNSGGPLFDSQGRLVGINGRISLKERGRVNVGVGYAVSVEQIMNFLPDLLATKVAQHGTLDAVFSNRTGGVICHSINLDSPSALAGLELGDRLVKFEGHPIRDANHFAGLISTLPAGWPVEVVCERDGRQQTFFVRLTALPYGGAAPRVAVPEPEPKNENKNKEDKEETKDEKENQKEQEEEEEEEEEEEDSQDSPPEKAKADDALDDDTSHKGRSSTDESAESATDEEIPPNEEKQPDEPEDDGKDNGEHSDKPADDGKDKDDGERPDKPPVVPPGPKIDTSNPGEIRDENLNREHCRRIIDRWRADTLPARNGSARAVVQIIDDVRRGGRSVGRAELLLATDGRFRIDHTEFGLTSSAGFDGTDFWLGQSPETSRVVSPSEATDDPLVLQALVLASVFRDAPLTELGDALLDGSDKAAHRRACRIRITEADGNPLFVWLSLPGDTDGPQVRLLKVARRIDATDDSPAVVFSQWQTFGGLLLPGRRTLVTGIHERGVLGLNTTGFRRLDEVPEDLFDRRGGETPAGWGAGRDESGSESGSGPKSHGSAGASPSRAVVERPFAAAIANAQMRCVKIYGAAIGRESGYATGVIVSPDGDILTAQGIYLAGERIRVVLPDGSVHEATVRRRSRPLQVALLHIDAKTPDYFELSPQSNVLAGDWVLAVSNAFKVADGTEPLSVNLGIVSLRTRLSAKHGTQDVPYDADALLIDAITSNPGATGGALVGTDGRLAGLIGRIVESKSTGTRINYAVPADLLAAFLSGMPIETSAPETAGVKATLGVRLFALTGKRAPAYVDRVLGGSPALAAGLKADDLIVELAGKKVATILDFEKIEDTLAVGTAVQLLVKRKQQLIRMSVTPAKRD